MAWIGADLVALDGLARRFGVTSEACRAHAEDVARTAGVVVEQFTDAMAALERDAAALNADIDTSVAALRTQADATSWTGANRVRQDEILLAHESDVVAIRTSIEALVADAAGIVGGSLNPTLDGLRDDVTVAGTASSAVADTFAASVARQRQSFDLVLNGTR